MPCKDTTSEISIVLDKKDRLINFNYSKNTCGKEVGSGTGFLDFCIGKSVDVLVELEFDKLIDILDLSDSETQFLLFFGMECIKQCIGSIFGEIVTQE